MLSRAKGREKNNNVTVSTQSKKVIDDNLIHQVDLTQMSEQRLHGDTEIKIKRRKKDEIPKTPDRDPVDPCFKNVLRKELQKEKDCKNMKMGRARSQKNSNGQKDSNVQPGTSGQKYLTVDGPKVAEELEKIDKEFELNPDHIQVTISAGDENEFPPTSDEEGELDESELSSEEDSDSSGSEHETEYTQDTVSDADTVQTDSVVTLNRNKQ